MGSKPDGKKTLNIGKIVIELTIPNQLMGLKNTSDNNINAFDKKGNFLWNISKLLKSYSDENELKYYNELYFDIRPIDKDRFYCVGFNNHCEIDLQTEKIIKVINNR